MSGRDAVRASQGRQDRLVVDGQVERPLSLSVEELAHLLPQVQAVYDFHCREGWTMPNVAWEGVSLASILALARPLPSAHFVTVHAGGFTVVLSSEQASDPAVLIALRRDGAPLPSAEGSPLRLVGPPEWDCFLSVKWVERLELTEQAATPTGPAIALARIGQTGV